MFSMFNKVRDILFGNVKRTVKIVSDYIPMYKTEDSACFDLISNESHVYKKNELYNLGTGLRTELPKGFCLLVFARSSLGQKKLIIPNSVGIIDADYRGEIKVPLISFNEEDIVIEKNERIAQAMLIKPTKVNFLKQKVLSQTVRGEGGFGSTGLF